LQQPAWRGAGVDQVLAGMRRSGLPRQARVPAEPVGMLDVTTSGEITADRGKGATGRNLENHGVIRYRHSGVKELSGLHGKHRHAEHDCGETSENDQFDAAQRSQPAGSVECPKNQAAIGATKSERIRDGRF